MGSSQAKPLVSSGGAAILSSDFSNIPDGYFGVRVTNDPSIKVAQVDKSMIQKLEEEAYQRGKMDAQSDIQRDLAKVAAHVYENVQEQILSIQAIERENAKSKAQIIKEKLDATHSPVFQKYCTNEQNNLIQCLNKNGGSPLECRDIVFSFTKCVDNTCANDK